jgi:hypothetical protein
MKLCATCGKEWPDDFRLCPADGSTLRSAAAGDDLVDSIIAERYHISKKLGQGGMGAVYLGEHVKMGQLAAIKVITRALAGDPAAIARFTREARNAAQIKHPNVCMIHDFGETPDGLIYMAMEYIEGESLADLLRRDGRLPLDRAARILMQCCDALQAAHDLDIVHRDIKPENVMITKARDGRDVVKVVDFGIAKAVTSESGQTVTQTGFIVGTPDYMSPDQVSGMVLDGRSDIYSLAVVFFRMVTGELPFRGETPQDALMARLGATPLKLRDALPAAGFSPELQAVLDRALAQSREARYASAIEFGEAVVTAVKGDTGEATQPTATVAAALPQGTGEPARSVAQPAATPETPQPHAGPSSPRHRSARAAVGIGAVVIIGAVGLWRVTSAPTPGAADAETSAAPPESIAAVKDTGPTTGTVSISGMPRGGTVLAGGRVLQPPFELPQGRHELEFRAPGYETKTVDVDVVAGERVTVLYAAQPIRQPPPRAATQPESRPRPAGRSVSIGQTVSGRLSNSDPEFQGRHSQTWTVESPGSTPVEITMRSTEFDTYLYLTGPGLSQPLVDDDGGGNTDSRITTTLRRGTYAIVASQYSEAGIGSYTLSVTRPGGGELSTEGRTLRVGQRANGTLTASDQPFRGRRVQAWAFNASPGTNVDIQMRSEAFDAYLFLTGPGIDDPISDDDGGSGTDARLRATLTQGGTYHVLASSFTAATGPYSLEVSVTAGLEQLRTENRVLAPGTTVSGILARSDQLYDGRHVQVFELRAPAGARIRISLQSDQFDTYLWLAGPGIATVLSNDDGGAGTNSQLDVTLPQGGTYRVAAGGYSESSVGTYRLSVVSQ